MVDLSAGESPLAAAVRAVSLTDEVLAAGFISRRSLIESFSTDEFGGVLADVTSEQITNLLFELGERDADPTELKSIEQPITAQLVSESPNSRRRRGVVRHGGRSTRRRAGSPGVANRHHRPRTLRRAVARRWLALGPRTHAVARCRIDDLPGSAACRRPRLAASRRLRNTWWRVMWPLLNPLSLFGDAVGGAVGWAWDKVIQGVYTWFASGVLMLMEWVWSVLDSATTPRLTDEWFASGLVAPLAAISLSIVVAMMLASAIQAGFGGRPELIIDALKEGPKAIAATAVTLVVMDVLIRGADVLAEVAWQAGRGDTATVMDSMASIITRAGGLAGTFLGPLALLLGMLGLLVTAVVLFMRSALLYLVGRLLAGSCGRRPYRRSCGSGPAAGAGHRCPRPGQAGDHRRFGGRRQADGERWRTGSWWRGIRRSRCARNARHRIRLLRRRWSVAVGHLPAPPSRRAGLGVLRDRRRMGPQRHDRSPRRAHGEVDGCERSGFGGDTIGRRCSINGRSERWACVRPRRLGGDRLDTDRRWDLARNFWARRDAHDSIDRR